MTEIRSQYRPQWTLRTRLAAGFFIAFLTIQILVPLVKLAGPRPGRFGWQMFSSLKVPARFELEKKDGTIEPIQLGDYFGNPRGDLVYEDYLPAHLFRTHTDAAAVVIRRADGSIHVVRENP